MNIMAISDHGLKEGFANRIYENNIDLIITCGDFSIFGLAQLREITDIPKIGVYGNHCTRGYMEEHGIFNLHLKQFEFMGLSFGGFEGSVRYKADPYAVMWTQEEADILVPQMPIVDIIVTHCPPRGINDASDLPHTGFNALRDYLITNTPKAWFHGHTYPSAESLVTSFNETRIIYTDPEIIVQI